MRVAAFSLAVGAIAILVLSPVVYGFYHFGWRMAPCIVVSALLVVVIDRVGQRLNISPRYRSVITSVVGAIVGAMLLSQLLR